MASWFYDRRGHCTPCMFKHQNAVSLVYRMELKQYKKGSKNRKTLFLPRWHIDRKRCPQKAWNDHGKFRKGDYHI